MSKSRQTPHWSARARVAALAAGGALALTGVLAFLLSDSGTLWEDEKYAVYWIDSRDNIELGIKIDADGNSLNGRGRPISVGSNDTYLVVRDTDGYHYVVKAEDDWREDFPRGHHGPYTLAEFDEIKHRLNLPDFEKNF